ncbi:FtsQ-type POTRA domain-containing protein [bacterium]|nr:FtsQ-type POTRA domain-containing protein [bacterium]
MGRRKDKSGEKNIKGRFVIGFYAGLVFIMIVPIVVGIVSLFNYIKSSDMFSLKEIVVEGNKRVSEQTAKDSIEINPNEKIYNINIQEMKNELKQNPLVENVVVKRQLPDRIIIDLQERETFALVLFKGKFFEVDVNGILLSAATENKFKVPVIEGIKGIKEINLGSKLDVPKFNKALKVLKEVLTSDVCKYFNIVKINIANIRQVKLYTQDDIEIQLGNDGVKKKLETLGLLLSEKKTELQKVRYIDLRFGGVIIRGK